MGLHAQIPKLEELWFRKQMLSDPETMSYNAKWGGTIPFPEEKWETWFKIWFDSPDHYYRYLLDEKTGNFVGEISYHKDDDDRCMCDVIIKAEYRGYGYGGKGLVMLCDAAKAAGIDILYDEIAADNPSVEMFLSHGFEEGGKTPDSIIVRKTLS